MMNQHLAKMMASLPLIQLIIHKFCFLIQIRMKQNFLDSFLIKHFFCLQCTVDGKNAIDVLSHFFRQTQG